MVQQTRRVVENYVLYKIHSSLSVENYSSNGANGVNKEKSMRIIERLPTPQQYSQIDLAIRSIACQYETRYADTFPDLLEELRNANVSAQDINHIFSKISKDLFQLPYRPILETNHDKENGNIAVIGDYGVSGDDSHIKWGHVIALLVFAGILSVRAVECDSVEIVDHIISWVTKFFDTELLHWIASKGGWENFVQWSSGSCARNDSKDDFDPNRFASGIRSLMSVGVLAACVGLGALMMVKK